MPKPQTFRFSLPAPRGFALVALGLTLPGVLACARPYPGVVAEAYVRNSEKAKREAPRPERLVVRDPETKDLLVDKRRISLGDRGFTNDGPQRTWYPGGVPKTFREYANGEPIGHWLTWWATGLIQSSYVFDPARETPMVWWHANGIVASEGLARNGQRVGPWIYRREDGTPESEGSYAGGQRDGNWTFYGEDGEWMQRGRYVAGKRIGEWEYADAPARIGQ